MSFCIDHQIKSNQIIRTSVLVYLLNGALICKRRCLRIRFYTISFSFCIAMITFLIAITWRSRKFNKIPCNWGNAIPTNRPIDGSIECNCNSIKWRDAKYADCVHLNARGDRCETDSLNCMCVCVCLSGRCKWPNHIPMHIEVKTSSLKCKSYCCAHCAAVQSIDCAQTIIVSDYDADNIFVSFTCNNSMMSALINANRIQVLPLHLTNEHHFYCAPFCVCVCDNLIGLFFPLKPRVSFA